MVLLSDIRTVFQMRKVDRMSSAALIEALVEIGDGRWAEFRGVNDDRPPRKFIQPELAQLLRPFPIGSRTIWPLPRWPGDKSSRGYLQSQFEQAWRCTALLLTHQNSRAKSCVYRNPDYHTDRHGTRIDSGIIGIMKPEPQPSDREVLARLVERVTYQNAENGFCVIRVKARGHRDLVTVVGHAAVISAGEWITASGDWTNDRTRGRVFKGGGPAAVSVSAC